jgi:DMSO/TMAO reductase YedYZ molybdopterin-dependent catalytic subunit
VNDLSLETAVPTSAGGTRPNEPVEKVNVGRRVFLGLAALGALGVAFGNSVQNFVGGAFGSGLGGLLPGGDRFRIYSITGGYPKISREKYRLQVSGLVEHPTTFTLRDLQSMPKTSFTKAFQCVTGWRVPDVHWEGVKLSDILERVGVQPSAVAVSFDSYDGADTESLSLEQAHLPDVIVAYSMLGAPVTTEHGGPVRLYVAPMFGYKSLKWLSGIRVVDVLEPGFWEQNGYPVNGWLDGTTGPNNPDPGLT